MSAYEINALLYGSSMAAYNQETIAAALAAIGTTTKATLLLRPGTWVISDDFNMSSPVDYSNVTIHMPAGSLMQIASGKTVTIAGPFSAGLYQVFSGDGTVLFGSYGVERVYPEWWGAIADNITNCQPAIQAAIQARTNYVTVELTGENYKTTDPIVYPVYSKYITLMSKCKSRLYAAHNGDCLTIHPTNENYGWHTIQGVVFDGPNATYPTVPQPSTGAAIYLEDAYRITIKDCDIFRFKYGIYFLDQSYLDEVANCYIGFNDYGIYIAQGNANSFIDCYVRENRIHGLHIEGVVYGASGYPTVNNFVNCTFESNLSYLTPPNPPDDSVGVWIKGGYFTQFKQCYSEGNRYAIYLSGPLQNTSFDDFRLGANAANEEFIVIDGTSGAPVNNSFTNIDYVAPYDVTNVLVNYNSETGSIYTNKFHNCRGLNFDNIGYVSTRDLQKNANSVGTISHEVVFPAYTNVDVGIGVTPGTISAVNVLDATMNLCGIGLAWLNTGFTDDTSVVSISMYVGQFSIIYNHQATHSLTLVHSANTLHCPGGVDVVIAPKQSVLLVGINSSITQVLTAP